MVMIKEMIELTLKDLWQEVKGEDDWWGEVKEQTLRVVRRLLEGAMQEEILEQLRVDRYRRDKRRRGYRNGYRYRSLLTEFGLLLCFFYFFIRFFISFTT
jgi:transposase-like protein